MIEVKQTNTHTHTHTHTCAHREREREKSVKLFALSPQKQLKGNIPPEELFVCSNYLIGLVFRSLREMFSNACKKNTSKKTAIIVLVQYLYHQYKHLPLSSSVIVMMMSLLCSMFARLVC